MPQFHWSLFQECTKKAMLSKAKWFQLPVGQILATTGIVMGPKEI